MKKEPAPNFLTCPAFPGLPEPPVPKREEVAVAPPKPIPPPPTQPVVPKQEIQPSQPAPQAEKPRRRRWVVWGLVVICLAGVAAATVPAGIQLVGAGIAVLDAKKALETAKGKMEKLDVEGAKSDVAGAKSDLGDARDALHNTGFWRDLPGIGTQIRAMEDAASAGTHTLTGAGEILDIVQVVVDALRGGSLAAEDLQTGIAPTRRFQDLSRDEKRTLLSRFHDALPELRLARENIDLALESWQRIPQDELYAPLRQALKPVADLLPTFQKSLDQAVPLIEAAVPLAGYPQKTTYLVVLQNADEMRPTGGFVGNVGTMTLDSGEFTDFAFTDVYNIDNPASYAWKEVPPQPMAERLGSKAWYLRDANWSPDFPTSAERMLDFYRREVELGTGKPLADPPTAVIALEPAVFQALLRLTGPVTVEGQTFDQNNFFDKIQYQVEEGFLKQGIHINDRKAIVGKIGDALMAKLKALPAARWPEVLDVLTKALERKQIQMYAQDKALLEVMDRRGWTGRAQATRGDFLWVVDANLGALKTDGMMDKAVSYAVDLTDPRQPRATVTLTYHNNTKTIDWRYTRYRSYTRIYVPEGSELVEASGAMKDDLYRTGGVFTAGKVDVMKELGKTVFGAFWSIEPGKTGKLSFTYKLPPAVAEQLDTGSYRLDWPKQAGADDSKLTLDLKLGKNIRSAVPPEPQAKWGDGRYELSTDSTQDRTFEIQF